MTDAATAHGVEDRVDTFRFRVDDIGDDHRRFQAGLPRRVNATRQIALDVLRQDVRASPDRPRHRLAPALGGGGSPLLDVGTLEMTRHEAQTRAPEARSFRRH